MEQGVAMHGSLTIGDSVVPLAVSWPWATAAMPWALSPVERQAMERALTLPREERQP